jgi:hypothetical protein
MYLMLVSAVPWLLAIVPYHTGEFIWYGGLGLAFLIPLRGLGSVAPSGHRIAASTWLIVSLAGLLLDRHIGEILCPFAGLITSVVLIHCAHNTQDQR